MTVPEAAVHEDDGTARGKHQIGPPWQVLAVQPETKADGVKRALPGMALTHLPAPPSAIPVKADFQYFSVSRSGPCWDHIVQTRQIGLYVPGDLPNPSLELLVILEA